jgi:hypothetical protein
MVSIPRDRQISTDVSVQRPSTMIVCVGTGEFSTAAARASRQPGRRVSSSRAGMTMAA